MQALKEEEWAVDGQAMAAMASGTISSSRGEAGRVSVWHRDQKACALVSDKKGGVTLIGHDGIPGLNVYDTSL